MLIEVNNVIGSPSAISASLGERVSQTYGDRWRNEVIEIDFAGIRSVSPSFLSQATRPIILSVSDSELPNRLIFHNVPASFELVWRTVMRAAERIRNSTSDAA